jgi:F-type H+-transporting ATPase subunit epsilon
MADTLQLEIVTPEKVLFSGAVEMVEAPGTEGDFGVLPNHSPFVSLLREGAVRVHQQGKITEFPVSGGLAQVDSEKCVVLAEGVISA